jgi:hypothetical protein
VAGSEEQQQRAALDSPALELVEVPVGRQPLDQQQQQHGRLVLVVLAPAQQD